jgi:hypothetical protein
MEIDPLEKISLSISLCAFPTVVYEFRFFGSVDCNSLVAV